MVSCGGIQSPRLLLLSRSERFPNGIGNEHDRVGRGFNEHPSLNFYGRIRSLQAPCVEMSRFLYAHGRGAADDYLAAARISDAHGTTHPAALGRRVVLGDFSPSLQLITQVCSAL